jgi:DNA-nicking Smr family endonuclease
MAKKPSKPAVSDASLFNAAMRDVEALKKKAAVAPPALPPDKPQQGKPKTGTTAAAKPRQTPRPPMVTSQRLAPLNPGRSGDVDTRTVERLRRGQLRPEARLDLHGMTQAEAHRALERFVPQARDAGKRCIIVITGKGSVSAGGGVLRNAVPGWLNSPSLRSAVLAYAEAIPRDGGAGALYVLLRRVR